MRVAAIYDIHGNLPALEAVLQDVRQAEVDRVLVGGDVVPGPMPRETLTCLLGLDIPVQFIQGNGEVAVLEGCRAHSEHELSASPRICGTVLRLPSEEAMLELFAKAELK